ncbi:atherin [Hyalella azteca]|uniref:Atherin n=1 Tax=Hyalella azteca TaxID=294128 RepID=A0A8B7PEH9_HYAAZ|nr:atherin [Hyalella azteca]
MKTDNMVSNEIKNMIIRAIQVLRSRRVRPNLKKIAWLIQRQHSYSEKTLLGFIEALVESKDILRVHFKGAISYRVPPNTKDAGEDERPTTTLSRDASSDSSESDPEIVDVTGEPMHNIHKASPSSDFSVRTSQSKGSSSSRGRSTGYSVNQRSSSDAGMRAAVGSAPRPRMHAGPSIRGEGASSLENFDASSSKSCARMNDTTDSPTCSGGTIEDTISRVIQGGGGDGGVCNGATQRSGSSTPAGGGSEEGDSNEALEFETPCAPPRAPPLRGARRGRPPLSSLGLNHAQTRRPRQLSSRPKRAKRVYDPSEGGIIELPNNHSPSSQYQYNGGTTYPYNASSASTRLPTTGGSGSSYYCSSKRRSAAASNSSADYSCKGESLCDICQGDAGSTDEFLLRCSSCPATGHPSCLGYSAVLAERSRKQPWTCMDCKHCTVCNMDHLIVSVQHGPPHSYRSSQYNSTPGGGFPLTPRDSPIPGDDESRSSGGSGFDPSIPNATHWSVEEVVTHFAGKGFEEEAQTLKEQAIDGCAVLLLSRADVISSLGLKLGPALKLYRHVRVLQTRIPNPVMPT